MPTGPEGWHHVPPLHLLAGSPVGIVGDYVVAVGASRSGLPGLRRAGTRIRAGLGQQWRLRQRPVVVWPGPRARQGARAGTIAGAASVGVHAAALTRQAKAQ